MKEETIITTVLNEAFNIHKKIGALLLKDSIKRVLNGFGTTN